MPGKVRGSGRGGLGRGGSVQGLGRRQGAGRGIGRMVGPALGPEGFCVCTVCGTKVEHQRGIPCNQMTCPKCGSQMTRE